MLKTGSLSRDANRIALTQGNQFTAQDGTATPKKSPLAVSSTPIKIQPPSGATRVILKPITNDIRVSDEATAADHYFTIKAGDTLSLDCCNETAFWVLRDSADGTLNFVFITV